MIYQCSEVLGISPGKIRFVVTEFGYSGVWAGEERAGWPGPETMSC